MSVDVLKCVCGGVNECECVEVCVCVCVNKCKSVVA